MGATWAHLFVYSSLANFHTLIKLGEMPSVGFWLSGQLDSCLPKWKRNTEPWFSFHRYKPANSWPAEIPFLLPSFNCSVSCVRAHSTQAAEVLFHSWECICACSFWLLRRRFSLFYRNILSLLNLVQLPLVSHFSLYQSKSQMLLNQ